METCKFTKCLLPETSLKCMACGKIAHLECFTRYVELTFSNIINLKEILCSKQCLSTYLKYQITITEDYFKMSLYSNMILKMNLSISKRANLKNSTNNFLINQPTNTSHKGQIVQSYTIERKREVLDLIKKNQWTQRQASQMTKVPRGCIQRWLKEADKIYNPELDLNMTRYKGAGRPSLLKFKLLPKQTITTTLEGNGS